MPFYGYTTSPEIDRLIQDTPLRVGRWCVVPEQFIREGTVVADIIAEDSAYELRICFPALVEKLLTPEGINIKDSESLLKWNADGESIPYGKSYFELKKK